MTDKGKTDENIALLIDFLQGQLDSETAEALRVRLDNEPDLRKLRDNLANTFDVLALAHQPEPPADLAERTLAKIASVASTNNLIALQQMQRRSFRSTFSLRELAAMVAIMLVAASIIAPALKMAHQRGQQSLCASQMGQIGSALQTFGVNNNGDLPKPQGSHMRWLKNSEPHTSNSSSLFRLLKDRYLSSPTLFQCPTMGGASFTVRPAMTDFPKPHHISYSYQHSLGEGKLSILQQPTAGFASAMVILGDQTPMFKGGKFMPDKINATLSENHDQRGQNELYLDGHVLWVTDANVGVDGDNIFLVQGVVKTYSGDEQPASPTDTFLLPAHPDK